MKQRISLLLALLLCLSLALTGCESQAADTDSDAVTDSAAVSGFADAEAVVLLDTDEMFTDRDYEVGYDESTCVVITLDGDSASCDSDSVTVSGSTITITDEGTYLLTGTLTDGMVIVDADDSDKLQLVLDRVDICSGTSAALYIRQADKVFLTLASGSENTLSNGGSFVDIDENSIDAVIFSKDDLTLNGSGTLTVQSPAGHGIVSKDDLVITSGTYDITADSHGLSGKDSVRISEGTLTIVSGKGGVHAENADDSSLGYLYIAGGTFDITAEGDGLSAGSVLQIDGGTFTVTTGGGSANGESDRNDSWSRFGGMQYSADSTDEGTASVKGVKSSGDLVLNGGTFTVDAADDALHSNADLTVTGGTYTLSSGDDGVHADGTLTITGGTLNIVTSYEDIEGQSINLSGVVISVTASDDGLNASGGNDESGYAGFGGGMDAFSADTDCTLTISGGTLTVTAGGDGIDSNGSLTVTGGTVWVDGPTDSGNGALDYGTSATITGGTFVALGTSAMAVNFGSSSTQGSMLITVSTQQAGTEITLADSSGTVLVSGTAGKGYNSVLISCPGLAQGKTYTLTTGSDSTEITLSSLVYSSTSGGMSGTMGDNRGDRGGMH
ncbi:MAG: carbohydrate-binding domain-containing protein [Clostridiales bacterium]|nr:carbohydrate-binding domain-containing protein [Clostridiales bacterium]